MKLSVRSKRETIMAAILKGRSKPKCSKLATSKGPSEWRISKGTTDGQGQIGLLHVMPKTHTLLIKRIDTTLLDHAPGAPTVFPVVKLPKVDSDTPYVHLQTMRLDR